MIKKNISVMLLSSILLSFACNSNKDSRKKADSVNTAQDSLNNKQAGTGDWEVSGPDAKFAVEATNGGMAEVALGKVAQMKASNAAVKDFGAMMIKDHTKANQELQELAHSKKVVLPDSADSEERKLKENLMAKNGAEFDKAYVDAMVKDHQKDIALFEEARGKVKYPEMTAYIDKTIPVLKMHLSAIQKIKSQLK